MSLIKPLISERSLSESAKHRYTFVVDRKMTKLQIKKTIEKTFGVKVTGTATVNMAGKTYRTGKRWIARVKPDWKKAMVTIEPGKTIDLFETTKQAE